MEHDLPAIGREVMLLNARHFAWVGGHLELVLLAIQDIPKHNWGDEELRASEDGNRALAMRVNAFARAQA